MTRVVQVIASMPGLDGGWVIGWPPPPRTAIDHEILLEGPNAPRGTEKEFSEIEHSYDLWSQILGLWSLIPYLIITLVTVVWSVTQVVQAILMQI